MLERTFQHIPGVGPWREKDLWARGIRRWDDFPSADSGSEITSARWDAIARERIADARAAMAALDLAALARMLPVREHWRLYPLFAREAIFFDVEYDGDNVPTVAGALDDEGPRTFIRGRNFDELIDSLERRPFWVTFNGRCCDVPILERFFGARCPAPLVHVDLRFLCRRVKWKGGLKQIEEATGMARPPHLKGVSGLTAISLWRRFWAEREIAALRLLVEYNLYDAISLKALIERGYNEAIDALALDERRLVPFDRSEVLYDVSKLVLALAV